MSWQDRPYAGEPTQPELRIQFRKPSTAVGWLIVINVAVFIADAICQAALNASFGEYFGLYSRGLRRLWVWQPLTYMFVHGDLFHILFNMMGLYIFGTEFERAFGRQRFLQFYFTCGLVGGLAYVMLGISNGYYAQIPLVGASGGVYGLLVAAIIFFPHIQVVVVIFPMPIRVFGLIALAIAVLAVFGGQGNNFGGELCHLGGAVTALGVLYAWGIMPRISVGQGWTVLPGSQDFAARREGAWARKQKALAAEQAEVDAILAKVHQHGLQSLSRKEKKMLERATRRQQEEERRLGR